MDSESDNKIKEPIFHAPKVMYVSKRGIWPARIILLIITCYCLYSSIDGYFSDYISFDGDSFYFEDSPFMFLFIVVAYFVIATGAFWQLFKVKVKTTRPEVDSKL